MKVSARNVFTGKVSGFRPGSVNAEVEVALAGGEHIVAIITMESAKTLAIGEGREVVALVKAPWVMLMTDSSGVRLSARNCLAGTVKSVEPGSVNAEVVLSSMTIPLAIQSQALQTLEGQNVVFVRDEKGFEAREVKLGRTDGEITEILEGVAAGESYATHNSFTLKAELGKGEAAHED